LDHFESEKRRFYLFKKGQSTEKKVLFTQLIGRTQKKLNLVLCPLLSCVNK